MESNNYTKRVVILVILGFLFLLALAFFFTHSFIRVNVPDDAKGVSVTLTKINSQDEPQKIKKGLNILPTGNYSVNIVSGISITKIDTAVRPFNIATLNADIIPQQQVKKIARGASECVFGNQNAIIRGDVFSYECLKPASISHNQYVDHSIKTSALAQMETSLDVSSPYQDGLISIGNGEGGNTLVYINGNDIKIRSLKDITDTENDTSSYKIAVVGPKIFILDTTQKAIFELSDFEGSVNKVTLDTQSELPSQLTVFRVHDSRYYISTASSEGAANTGGEDSFGKGRIYIYNKNGGKAGKEFPISKNDDDISDFVVLGNNTLATTSLSQKTTIYDTSGSKLNKEYVIQNTAKTVANENRLYTLIDGQIYVYNPDKKILNLAFGSANIRVTRLQTAGNLVVFNGYANSDSQSVNQTYVFESGNVGNIKYRLEDRLPYGDVNLPIEWMDYFDNSIHIVTSLDSLRNDLNSTTGGFVYDQNEYNQKVQTIQEILNKDGFTSDKYSITFAPY